jgi:hypothetical protein
MAPPGAGNGATGNITAPSGTFVTSWALRNFVENGAGYGWTWESGTSSGNPTVKAEIRSSDGTFYSAGQGYFAGDVYTAYSDLNLKTILGQIENPLDKLRKIETFYYEPNATALELGAEPGRRIGLSAQSVQTVVPEAVHPAPINKEYLTVQYERLVPLLIESIKKLEDIVKEQQEQINKLEGKINGTSN